ncbi:MAG TPA: amino acid permease [Bacteroidales bacterium]|nr:amino acid permease [Bacteroidales bacterium]
MAKSNKFGTFPGVFTPSILTILGVIMYMRLGWVVGQAGMIAAIGIIIIAHIISVTTGLSISSIATDKKIKAGGIYYMLSRTLGLPMGGAIGIALFLGTALSISLYIIGFAESFLSIPAIAGFLHLQPGVEGYRIVGTAVIILLVVLAFISTSLAIKSQYLILGAIVLSLVSIFIGYFVHPEFAPAQPLLGMAKGDVSLELVFAIFFPAVTGFTAGVAMSGDLKDPKKSIPVGTIMAITVGFIVYMTMAISFACFVGRDYLLNDTNIVIKIAWIPALVIAGIWGATLSSALGGILGGPRILQALSKDKVMPKIFGKGYGSSNEPRNALIMIFIIAEGGILIGELNMIAGIVTMFYLASYGFINLAYVLESWASTDFRPSFKVSSVFGIIGFVFAFAIMFKLDVLSMLAAFAIMGGIYFILKRKQLKLDFGDVWQSVWNSVIRKGLHRLSVKTIEERNWQPNIILFSGGTEIRSYLIEFGKSLVGKFGLLSNFDLIEESSAKVLFPKHQQQRLNNDEESQGIFTRQQSCKDIYDGIEMIASTYGFSGIEPNTIILGWARQTKNPVRFHQLLRTINDLDFNILLIDYDKRFGYGKHQQIDIWWRGEGNNGNLALTLSKFMASSIAWENAKIRLMVVNYENDKASYIQRHGDEILARMRLDAEVRVINNQIDQKPIYDIIRLESKSADIVFVGIPEIKEDDEADFVEKTNLLLKEIGTVVLLKASSVFNDLSLGVNKEQDPVIGIAPHDISVEKEMVINSSVHEQLNVQIQDLSSKTIENYKSTFQVFVLMQEDSFSKIFKEFRSEFIENSAALLMKFRHLSPDRLNRVIVNSHHSLFNKLNKQFFKFKSRQYDQLRTLLETVITEFDARQKNIRDKAPGTLMLYFPREEFMPEKDDTTGFNLYKRIKRIGSKRSSVITVPFAFRNYFFDLHYSIYDNLLKTVEQAGKDTVTYLMKFQNLLKALSFEYDNYRKLSSQNKLTDSHILKSQQTILEQLDELDSFLHGFPLRASSYFNNRWTMEINSSLILTESLKSVYQFSGQRNSVAQLKTTQIKLEKIVDSYFSNLTLLLNANEAENYLLQFDSLVISELNEILKNSENFISEEIYSKIDKLIEVLNEMVVSNIHKEINFETLMLANDFLRKKIGSLSNLSVKKIDRILRLLPSEITVMDEVSFKDLSENQFDKIKTVDVSFLQMIEFLIENKISTQLNLYGNELQISSGERLIKIKELYLSYLLTFNEFTNKENEEKDSLHNFLLNQINKIVILKNEIIQSFAKYVSQVSGLKSEVSGHLTLYGITKFGEQLKHYIHEQQEQEQISFLKKKSKTIINWFSTQTVRYKYGKTQAIAYARIIQQENRVPGSDNYLLRLSEQIQPSPDLFKQIPFFYKQLFSVRQTFHKDLWVPLTNEIEQADIVYNQFRNLNEGVLLITGDHHSGKSFLSYILAHRWNESGRLVFINPPPGGSIDLQVFNEIVADTFQEERYNDSIFELLPPGSFVIFDDIELWWLRSENGLSIMNNLLRIITKFRNRIFFILNINIYAYKLLDKLIPISSFLLGVIKLNPLPVNSIKKMIMLRHQGAGIDFVYKGKRKDEISAVKTADLFVKIYKFSSGNPGVALASWLSGIKKVENDSIIVEPTELPYTDINYHLKSDAVLVIIQLLIHRQLTLKRLIIVLGTDPVVIERQLHFLWRMGMVNRLQNDVYEINIYWYSVLTQYLVAKNYI